MSLKTAKTQIFKFRGAKRRPKNLHRGLKFYIHIKLSSITPHTKFQAFILKTFREMYKKPAKITIFAYFRQII